MKIVIQGEKGDDFYIIRGGNVSITKRPPGGGPEEYVSELRRGDYFGEQALLHEDHRLATVTAKDKGAECLVLDRKLVILAQETSYLIPIDWHSLDNFHDDYL